MATNSDARKRIEQASRLLKKVDEQVRGIDLYNEHKGLGYETAPTATFTVRLGTFNLNDVKTFLHALTKSGALEGWHHDG